MPTSDQAIRKLTYELHAAKAQGIVVLKIIHGYGSSGTGGKIRQEARAYLARQVRAGKLKLLVEGERFSIFDAGSRALLEACGELRRERDLEGHNNGVSFVLL